MDHCGREPDAHIFLGMEAGQVLRRTEDSEDGEKQFLAHGVPEIRRECRPILLQRIEEGIESSAEAMEQSDTLPQYQ